MPNKQMSKLLLRNKQMPNNVLNYDIYERIFKFIVVVLNLIEKLPKSYSNQVITAQVTRSVTSMGANNQEADGTNTRKDFIHCFTTVRKESKESIYWLKLIANLNSNLSSEVQPIIQEGMEIVLIVSSIIVKTMNITNEQPRGRDHGVSRSVA